MIYESDLMMQEIPEDQSEGFCIKDDRQADWALRKIKKAKAELAEWESYYNKKLEAIRMDTQRTIDFMAYHLQLYFDTQKHHVTKGGTEKYSLPSGELIRKPGDIAYKRDDAALLAWCEANLPEAIKVKREASWSEVKKYMQATGDLPDGVTAEEVAPVFQAKEAK